MNATEMTDTKNRIHSAITIGKFNGEVFFLSNPFWRHISAEQAQKSHLFCEPENMQTIEMLAFATLSFLLCIIVYLLL